MESLRALANGIKRSKFQKNPQSFQRHNSTQEIGVRTLCVTLGYTLSGSHMEWGWRVRLTEFVRKCVANA
jgi:hypothetical protein